MRDARQGSRRYDKFNHRPDGGPPTSIPALKGNDIAARSIVAGGLTFWLFAQTTLNVPRTMQQTLEID